MARKRKAADAPRELLKKLDPTRFVEYVRARGDINLWFANATTHKAREGDTASAREILKDFVAAIDARSERAWSQLGPPIHWAHARYLADAFAKILGGADAAVALGVKNSRPGPREGAKSAHDLDGLAAALNLLYLNGLKPKQAKLYLMERTGAAIRTIEKANKEHLAYRYYLRHAEHPSTSAADRDFAAEIMKNGAKRYAAEIAAILAARKTL